MKKTIFLLTILSLVALPMAANAAVSSPTTPGAIEFSLGGFVKMEVDWDSTQMNKNITTAVARNNDFNFHHGRLKLTAEGSRFNFSFKGPKLWGATVTGLIEMDFDTNFNILAGHPTGNVGGVQQYSPRLRHAMFRLNWPETELLMGQFWSFFSEFTPEAAHDGANQFTGAPNHRLAQIRITQKFLGVYTVSFMIARPYDPAAVDALFEGGLQTPGASSETPQLQGKFSFEQDLWGKAAFYGVPRGFVAQIATAWQRTRYRSGAAVMGTFGQDQFNAVGVIQENQQYLNNWVVMGTLFIPLIPTSSANLAGTASLTAQWYVGEGLSFIGEARDQDTSFYTFKRILLPGLVGFYDRELMARYGGHIQGQYYFTNQWYLNAVWGMSKAFNVGANDREIGALGAPGPGQFKYASNNDQTKMWQVYSLTLWYRPITALKFGLEYAYAKTDWFQKAAPVTNVVIPGQRITGIGEDHRIMFAGFFFF